MEETIFTKIIKGAIPCYKIYEDDLVLAFLDIHPVQPGHTLVVPKRQVEFVWDLTDEEYVAVMLTAKKIAGHMRDVLDVRYVGERIIGVDVPHAHVQLIPFNVADEFNAHQDMNGEPDGASLKAIERKLTLLAV